MIYKWLPWKYIISRLARSQGFLDPLNVWASFERFAQPAEVAGPVELIRDSAVFHARGLINSRAIPHNLDWIWPHWVHHQFDPDNRSFIPRAFSLTYINLTQRNWTAVGLPDCQRTPVIDQAGLIMPFWNGWSLDCWLLDNEGRLLAPSRDDLGVQQRLFGVEKVAIINRMRRQDKKLLSAVEVVVRDNQPACRIVYQGTMDAEGWLVVAVRPYNPEGIEFIYDIHCEQNLRQWTINKTDTVHLHPAAARHIVSNYHEGDVARHLLEQNNTDNVHCNVGLATAALMYKIHPRQKTRVEAHIPLKLHASAEKWNHRFRVAWQPSSWPEALNDHCTLQLPDKRIQQLWGIAQRSIVQHTAEKQVYPGPFTYKRFWFRDAAFILQSLMMMNLFQRAKDILDTFPLRQRGNGYFHSQEGEWDSNGQTLWIMNQYCLLNQYVPDDAWIKAVKKGAEWICRKRLPEDSQGRHSGLMPAGFSAEHFGPNDYYYWDDFWSIAGLTSAADMLSAYGDDNSSNKYNAEAASLKTAVERSLHQAAESLKTPAMPVSPYRRMDAGAVGSLAAGYPAQVFSADDRRLAATADYLVNYCLHDDGFFLDISHSGINPYLTLHIAQILMQSGDLRFFRLVNKIADAASATGQWPEAIHPRSGGGCMGDGQHIWASAEWILMIRNCLVHEKLHDKELILGRGVIPQWLKKGTEISLGPAPTIWGTVHLDFLVSEHAIEVKCPGQWHNAPPAVYVQLPGYPRTKIPDKDSFIHLERKDRE